MDALEAREQSVPAAEDDLVDGDGQALVEEAEEGASSSDDEDGEDEEFYCEPWEILEEQMHTAAYAEEIVEPACMAARSYERPSEGETGKRRAREKQWANDEEEDDEEEEEEDEEDEDDWDATYVTVAAQTISLKGLKHLHKDSASASYTLCAAPRTGVEENRQQEVYWLWVRVALPDRLPGTHQLQFSVNNEWHHHPWRLKTSLAEVGSWQWQCYPKPIARSAFFEGFAALRVSFCSINLKLSALWFSPDRAKRPPRFEDHVAIPRHVLHCDPEPDLITAVKARPWTLHRVPDDATARMRLEEYQRYIQQHRDDNGEGNAKTSAALAPVVTGFRCKEPRAKESKAPVRLFRWEPDANAAAGVGDEAGGRLVFGLPSPGSSDGEEDDSSSESSSESSCSSSEAGTEEAAAAAAAEEKNKATAAATAGDEAVPDTAAEEAEAEEAAAAAAAAAAERFAAKQERAKRRLWRDLFDDLLELTVHEERELVDNLFERRRRVRDQVLAQQQALQALAASREPAEVIDEYKSQADLESKRCIAELTAFAPYSMLENAFEQAKQEAAMEDLINN